MKIGILAIVIGALLLTLLACGTASEPEERTGSGQATTGGYLLGGTRYWWLIVPPGASITLLCSAFYLAGRALDEVVNPRQRRRNDRWEALAWN